MPRPILSNELKRPVRVSGRISSELKTQLDDFSISERRSVSTIIELAIKAYLDKER